MSGPTTRGVFPIVHLLGCASLLLTACGQTEPPPVEIAPTVAAAAGPAWFEEVATAVDFVAISGHAERFLFPEIVFGGVALLDADGDGDLDLYLVQAGSLGRPQQERFRNALYRNDGEFRFTDITADSGAADAGYGMGVAAGDYDGDGRTDLYVTNVGRNTLLHNEGDGRFRDVTEASGTGDEAWGTSAAFVDYDHDGDLDLYVANYVNWTLGGELDCYDSFGSPDYCLPTNYNAPAADTLLRNDGNGRFTDVSARAGLLEEFGNGLGVTYGDFNDDGRVDIYVANDTNPNQLWINSGDGSFEPSAMLMGCALDEHGSAKAGMGVLAADMDADDDLDLLVVNLSNQSDSFYRNDGGYFSDRTAVVGLGMSSRIHTRFGVGLLDFDNDGRLDLYHANGGVQISAEPFTDDPFAQPNLLFRGLPDGRFEPVRPDGGVIDPGIYTSRGAAFGDLDGDGGVDVVVANRDGPVQILRNVLPGRGHWLLLRVLDRNGSPALGATVRAEIGGVPVRRDVLSAFSYCAANDARVHLGLGDATVATNVRVRWTDGTEESFGDLDADRIVALIRGQGR